MSLLDVQCLRHSLLIVWALGVIDCNGARKFTARGDYCEPVTIDFTLVKAKNKGSFMGDEMSLKMKPKSMPSSIFRLSMFSSESYDNGLFDTYWHYRNGIKEKSLGFFWFEKYLGFDKGLPTEFEEAYKKIAYARVEKWIIDGEEQHDTKMASLLPKLAPNSAVTWVLDSDTCKKNRAYKSGQRQTGGNGVPPRVFHGGPGSPDWEDALKALELAPNSRPALQEIKDAYKAAALKWHPDKNKDKVDTATEMFKKLGPARDILVAGL